MDSVGQCVLHGAYSRAKHAVRIHAAPLRLLLHEEVLSASYCRAEEELGSVRQSVSENWGVRVSVGGGPFLWALPSRVL